MTTQNFNFVPLAKALRSEEDAGAKVNTLVADVAKAGFTPDDFKGDGAQYKPMKAALIAGYLTAAERKALDKEGAAKGTAGRAINARINRQMQAVRVKLAAMLKAAANAEDAPGNAPKGKGTPQPAGSGKAYSTRLKDRVTEIRNGLKSVIDADTDKRAADLKDVGEETAKAVLQHLDAAVAAFAKKK